MKNEPALTISGIIAALGALLYLLTEFGLSITNNQQAAIVGFAVVVAPLISGALTRGKVTPTHSA